MATIRKRGKTYQIDYFDPTGKRIRKSFKKKKDAEAELGKRVSLIAEGRYLDVKPEYSTTLGDALKVYEKNYKDQPSYGTAKRFFVENFKQYFKEETLLTNIRFVDIETYRNHLRQQPTKRGKVRTPASVNREISCLRHLFKKAVEWEMIDESPFARGRSLLIKENNQRLRFLSQDEIVRLLTACSVKVIEFPQGKRIKKLTRHDPDYLRDIVEGALLTGMRKGELLGLKWNQVRNGFIYLDKTKTDRARQIPINNDLEGLFDRIKKRQARNRLKKGGSADTDYVFTYQGSRIASTKLGFEAALKRAEIEDFTFHGLRHTFASHFVMRGGPLKALQEILGHTTLNMTMRYAHLAQEHKREAVNLMNGLTTNETVTKVSQNEKPVTEHVL